MSSSAPGENRFFIRHYLLTMRMIISISDLSATQVACERNKDSFRSFHEEMLRYMPFSCRGYRQSIPALGRGTLVLTKPAQGPSTVRAGKTKNDGLMS